MTTVNLLTDDRVNFDGRVMCYEGPLHGKYVSFVGPMLYWREPTEITVTAFTGEDTLPTTVDLSEGLHRYYIRGRKRDCIYVHQSVLDEERKREQIERLENRLKISPRDLRELHAPFIEAHAWTCGDWYCDCSSAEVVGWDSVMNHGLRRGYRVLWSGPFYTDGAPGAERDVQDLRTYLNLVAPFIATQICWPGS